MAIKITDGKLWDGHCHYLQGEMVTGLSEKEEARLISLKVAEKIDVVTKVINEKTKTDDPYAEKNAKDMGAIVASIEDIKDLEALLAYEQQNKKRKTIIEAINARMDELEEKEQDPEDPEDPEAPLNLNLNPEDVIVS